MKGELELEHEHDQQSIEDHSTVQIVQVQQGTYLGLYNEKDFKS